MSQISTEVVHHADVVHHAKYTNIKMSQISTEVVHHAKYKDTHQRDVKDLHRNGPSHPMYTDKHQDVKDLNRNGPSC